MAPLVFQLAWVNTESFFFNFIFSFFSPLAFYLLGSGWERTVRSHSLVRGSLNVIYHSRVGTFWGFLAEGTGSTKYHYFAWVTHLPQAVSPPAREQRVKCSRCVSVVRTGSNSMTKGLRFEAGSSYIRQKINMYTGCLVITSWWASLRKGCVYVCAKSLL